MCPFNWLDERRDKTVGCLTRFLISILLHTARDGNRYRHQQFLANQLNSSSEALIVPNKRQNRLCILWRRCYPIKRSAISSRTQLTVPSVVMIFSCQPGTPWREIPHQELCGLEGNTRLSSPWTQPFPSLRLDERSSYVTPMNRISSALLETALLNK